MSFFHVPHLYLFWDSALGNPFIDLTITIQADCPLVDVIHHECIHHDSNKASYIDFLGDIKLARSTPGMNAIQILEFPISEFFEILAIEKSVKLMIAIDKPAPSSTVIAKSKQIVSSKVMELAKGTAT